MYNVPHDHTDMFVSESRGKIDKEWPIWGPQTWEKSKIMKDI